MNLMSSTDFIDMDPKLLFLYRLKCPIAESKGENKIGNAGHNT